MKVLLAVLFFVIVYTLGAYTQKVEDYVDYHLISAVDAFAGTHIADTQYR